MKTIRIFIGSPDDVHEERKKAPMVVASLERVFEDRMSLKLIKWEDLGASAENAFQVEIERLFTEQQPIDIALFVFWWKMGTPPSTKTIRKADDSPYRSGTEHELDFMFNLAKENKEKGREGPHIIVYFRGDDAGIKSQFAGGDLEEIRDMLAQQRVLNEFKRTTFHDGEGRNLRSCYSYGTPVDFGELLYVHLRNQLERLDLEVDAQAWVEAPYRGLDIFDVRHAIIFYGREQEIYEIRRLLRERASEGCAFVCIVGASGSGKSSLARAGIAATLLYRSFDDTVKEWRVAPLYPGGKADLFAALVDCLAFSPPAEDEVSRLAAPLPGLAEPLREKLRRYLLNGNAEAATDLLEKVIEAEEKKIRGKISVLLVLDQLEEIWSDKIIPAEAFLRAVEILARVPRFAVLATMRNDFYPHAQESKTLMRLKGERGFFDLIKPDDLALREIIAKPARRAGLTFEHTPAGNLSDLILQEAQRDAIALPLLQYALGELHRRCREKAHEGGVPPEGAVPRTLTLTFAAYEEIGGVKGAITRRAAEVFAALPTEDQAALPELLPLLVAVEQGPGDEFLSVRLRPRLEALTGHDRNGARARLTATLVKARFLTTDHDKGVATITLTHEALLKQWQIISDWIQYNHKWLRIRSQIEQRYVHWKEEGEAPGLLLPRGPALAEGRLLLEKAIHLLAADEDAPLVAFIKRSVASDLEFTLASGVDSESVQLAEDLKQNHPALWEETLRHSLAAESSVLRGNAAALLRGAEALAFQEPLIRLLLHDPTSEVRLVAARALTTIESDEPFDRLLAKGTTTHAALPQADMRLALARLVAVSDMMEKRSRFADWCARLPRSQAAAAQQLSYRLRLQSSQHVFLFVLIPAVLFAMAGAAAIKWLPSMFNYSCVQNSASAFRGLFASAPAGFFVGGGTILGLTFYRMVVGREHDRLSLFRPFPALFYGAGFGCVAGFICVILIALVFSPDSLQQIGWTPPSLTPSLPSVRLPAGEMFRGLFITNRCGYAFPITCMGLGLGIAMMTNSLRASTIWPKFQRDQTAITSLEQAVRVVRGIIKLSLPYAWPIVVFTFLFAGIGLVIMQGTDSQAWKLNDRSARNIFLGGMDGTMWFGTGSGSNANTLNDITKWKGSVEGRALGLFGDVLSKIVGGYFAVVGMGLGIVTLRHGVRVAPQRAQR